MFVCCVQELFGHHIFNFIYYISFAQLHCVFFSTLHFSKIKIVQFYFILRLKINI
jgi:hypothetical protein